MTKKSSLILRPFISGAPGQSLRQQYLPSLRFARSPQGAAGFGVRVLAVFDHLDAVNENVFHVGRVLMPVFEGRVVGDYRGIAHYDVRTHSFYLKPAMIEPPTARRQPAQAP